jgi:hypothetical protein
MSLSTLLLALTLIFWAAIGFDWLAWSMNVVYVFALATGLLMIFEGIGMVTWKMPVRKV